MLNEIYHLLSWQYGSIKNVPTGTYIFNNSEYSKSLSETVFLAVKTSFVALKSTSTGALDERAIL